MGIYLRDCIDKAYEGCDDGIGVMYDSEEKMYLGPNGEEATTYSIREILMDEEMIFNEDTIETTLLDLIMEFQISLLVSLCLLLAVLLLYAQTSKMLLENV